MAWETITVGNWTDFVALTAAWTVGDPVAVSFLHRGHGDAAWSLSPSLARALAPGVGFVNALAVEDALCREFRTQAHLHLQNRLPRDKDYLGWWQLMQHHGAPTRLLDWTSSPFVAAYFAVAEQPDADGVVWTMHPGYVFDAAATKEPAEFVKGARDGTAAEDLLVVPPGIHSQRSVAQQGHFTISTDPLADHGPSIEKAQGTQPPLHRKTLIPKALKGTFLRELRNMNVTAAALFPGVDGLGRSMRELARLASAYRMKGAKP